MDFQEFIKSRFCRPLVLPEEDCPQDATEWRRLVKEDQERQFTEYHRVGVVAVEKTDEERRVERFLASKNLPVPVLAEPSCAPKSCEGGEAREQHDGIGRSLDGSNPITSRGGQKFDKVAYQRDYMRKRRAAQKAK